MQYRVKEQLDYSNREREKQRDRQIKEREFKNRAFFEKNYDQT